MGVWTSPYLLLATHILMLTVLGEKRQEKSSFDHTWVHTNMQSAMPSNMVNAGKDSNGDPIYVGRVNYNGEILPAKVIPNKKRAYTSSQGFEYIKTEVDILVGHYYTWMPANRRVVPSSAVCVGKTNAGEPLYMGRAKWNNTVTPGKFQVSHNALYIPFDGVEYRIDDNYEILIQPEKWISGNGGQYTDKAVRAGRDVDGKSIYVARAYHKDNLIPGKGIPERGVAYIGTGGKEFKKDTYEVLVGNSYHWVKDSKGHVPKNAVAGGYTKSGEILYIGRAEFLGGLSPGKIHQSHGCLYVPYKQKEFRFTEYEVLVRRTCN